MASENKVQFNLKNVHYAILTETVSSGVTSYSWATPVAVPGAVSLSLDAEGDTTKFYADGRIYYATAANNGYSGDLEMARFPDQMLEDVWGYTLDGTAKVLVENANTEPKSFALLFQIDGDEEGEYYCLYNCTGTRPGVGGATIETSKDPATKSSTIVAAPLASGKVLARTTHETTSTVKTGWFSSVTEY